MKTIRTISIICLTGLAFLLMSCESKKEEIVQRMSVSDIAESLKKEAQLATTEVEVRKIVYWDEDNQAYALTDIKNHVKQVFGSRKFLFPLHGTLRFGFDLGDFSSDDVKVTPDSTLIITLPEPIYITGSDDFSDQINPDSLIEISTGLRGNVGTQKIREVFEQQKQKILASTDDILNPIKGDIKENARSLFENLVKGYGWTVEIRFKGDQSRPKDNQSK